MKSHNINSNLLSNKKTKFEVSDDSLEISQPRIKISEEVDIDVGNIKLENINKVRYKF